MTSTAHTPGPWQANQLDNGHFTISTQQYVNICQMARNKEPEGANARLIAAAPELLEALKEYVTGTSAERNHSTCEERPCTLCKIAKRAIAKAEGRQ